MTHASPHRLPQADYPALHELLDDVLTLGFWVQRQALRWAPGTPDREDLELAWLERYLGELEHAARVAREKVGWRGRVAAAAREREENTDAWNDLEAKWENSRPEPTTFASSNAPSANAGTA